MFAWIATSPWIAVAWAAIGTLGFAARLGMAPFWRGLRTARALVAAADGAKLARLGRFAIGPGVLCLSAFICHATRSNRP